MTSAIRQYQDTVKTHSHDQFHQIIIPFMGGLEIDIEGTQGIVEGRKIGVVVQGERHSFRADNDNRFLVLDVENGINHDLDEFWQYTFDKPFLLLSEASMSLINYARYSFEYDNNGGLLKNWQSLFIQTLASELNDGLDQLPERIKKVLHYIEMNYACSISNINLADIACLSSSQFHQVFQNVMGVSPQCYVTNRRLIIAKQLMLRGQSLAMVSGEVGFSDQASFSRAFKQKFGISPGLWRKQELALRKSEFG